MHRIFLRFLMLALSVFAFACTPKNTRVASVEDVYSEMLGVWSDANQSTQVVLDFRNQQARMAYNGKIFRLGFGDFDAQTRSVTLKALLDAQPVSSTPQTAQTWVLRQDLGQSNARGRLLLKEGGHEQKVLYWRRALTSEDINSIDGVGILGAEKEILSIKEMPSATQTPASEKNQTPAANNKQEQQALQTEPETSAPPLQSTPSQNPTHNEAEPALGTPPKPSPEKEGLAAKKTKEPSQGERSDEVQAIVTHLQTERLQKQAQSIWYKIPIEVRVMYDAEQQAFHAEREYVCAREANQAGQDEAWTIAHNNCLARYYSRRIAELKPLAAN